MDGPGLIVLVHNALQPTFALLQWWGATVVGPGKAEEGETEPHTFELL